MVLYSARWPSWGAPGGRLDGGGWGAGCRRADGGVPLMGCLGKLVFLGASSPSSGEDSSKAVLGAASQSLNHLMPKITLHQLEVSFRSEKRSQ